MKPSKNFRLSKEAKVMAAMGAINGHQTFRQGIKQAVSAEWGAVVRALEAKKNKEADVDVTEGVAA